MRTLGGLYAWFRLGENEPPVGRVGGQAVIEGVMMQHGPRVAVAVRTPEGEIEVRPLQRPLRGGRWTKIPFLRGPVRLYEMLTLGMRALRVSAELAAGQEGKTSRWEFPLMMITALVLVAGGFVALPVFLAGLLPLEHRLVVNLVEGGVRVAFFLLYLGGISLIPDIRRVFQYHGAEHQAVHAYEAGRPELELARRKSPLHPRCGTTFLLLAVVISILVFSLLPAQEIWLRILARLALLPVVAGVAYEVLMVGGRHPRGWWLRPFLVPGLLLQRLTTRKPTEDQLEVALAALDYVTSERAASSSTTS
jgi:uncharacterized protein YqhQ